MKYNQWKTLSVPIINNEFLRNPERTVARLKESGAQFVFVAWHRTFDPVKYQENLDTLPKIFRTLSAEGFEVGCWIQAFGFGVPISESEAPWADFTKITSIDGRVCGDAFCPTDPKFFDYLNKQVCAAAKAGARYIMLDDDLCLNIRPGIGCACEKHLELFSKKIVQSVELKDIRKLVYAREPNEYRKQWLDCMGESLETFCKKLRQNLDEIDPTVRMGFCAGYTSWDMEGIDALSLTKVLAGNTRPFLRLSGAPYWAQMRRFPGQTVPHIVEFSRMQQAWCEEQDVDFFTENDSYPRPRYRIPAAYMETFDFCMTSSGCPVQIKYMFDYFSNPDYETGYVRAHLHNREMIEKTAQITKDLQDVGVYVHENMRKLEMISLPERASDDYIMRISSFSPAADLLSGLGIATTYHAHNGVVAAFGSSGKTVPTSRQKGYLLDVVSALELQKRGIDTGLLSATPSKNRPMFEYFKSRDDYTEFSWLDTTYESLFYDSVVNENAQVMSEFQYDGGRSFPASYRYTNAQGMKFFVLLFRADTMLAGGSLFRSYYRQEQLLDVISDMDAPLPAVIKKEPGAYLICRAGENKLAVSICNFSLDTIYEPHIKLSETWENAEYVGCSGTLKENEVKLSDLPPYSFACILLTR